LELGLKNKNILVTGSTGICKEVALSFAREGANVAITFLDEKDKNSAEDSIKKINKLNQKAISLHLDVRNLKEISGVVKNVISVFGKIDVLVNCAASCTNILAKDVTEEDWDRDMDISLKGLFFCCKEVFNNSMKKQKSGSIINIASVVGVKPVKKIPIYGASKAGVIHITKYLAIEWGEYNIRVNCISPGWTNTEAMIEHQKTMLQDQKTGSNYDPEYVVRFTPLSRYGTPREIAETIVFMASEKSSFMNGANLIIDGGLTSGIRLASLINQNITVT
jgi:NAD(P)-dependent dehydrogenase (short-subunit alcohol dehydrogenase family)